MTRSSARSASSTSSNHRGKPAAKKSRKHIQLDSQGPFSDAVIVGDMLYLSGRIGLDEFKRIPIDIDAEARNLMENVRAVLQKAGMQLDDLVYVQVFCTDVSLWERFNRIYRSYFKNKMPARAFIGSGRLLFGAHFEVQGIAIKST
ncbi:MAG: Rid family hydrolase [Candidatus Sulfotelmatobacter sp.]